MRNVWAVIKREYMQRVRTKWFLFGTFVVPLLFLAMMVLPGYFMTQDEASERVIVVADGSGVMFEGLAPRLERSGYTVSSRPWSPELVPALAQEVVDGEIGAFLVVDDETLLSGDAEFHALKSLSPLRQAVVQNAVTRTALEHQLDREGVDATALLNGGELRVELLSDDASGMDDPRWLIGYVGAFVMYLLFMLYGTAIMRSTLEEKTNRVVEVVVSAMKPWHLMLGKIIGVGSVSLTQLAVWLGIGVLGSSVGLPMLVAAQPELATMAGLRDVLPGAGLLALFVVMFVFGFFMYAGLFAAVGAMCNSDEEAQQAQLPVTMLVVAAFVSMFSVLNNPNSAMAVGLSLVPPLTPILMFVRAAVGTVPLWQLALSIGLMSLALVAIAWVAGRIYKVGILMSGKRPTFPELVRWVREA